MKQKLKLTKLGQKQMSDANGGGSGGGIPDQPKDCLCGGDLSHFADDMKEECFCKSIFYAIGLNL